MNEDNIPKIYGIPITANMDVTITFTIGFFGEMQELAVPIELKKGESAIIPIFEK